MSNHYLFDLIKSLTPNEKRYFNLFMGSSSVDKNYKKLFAAIEKGKVFGSKEMKKISSTTTMNVSYEMRYLHKMIMRALRNFHEEASTEIILHQILTDVEILFNKQQYDKCLHSVKNALGMAEEEEHFTMVLQLLKWERKILIRKGMYTDVSKQNKSLIEKEKECLMKIENIMHYKDIQATMLGLIAKKGNARQNEEMKEFRRIIKYPNLKDESLALSYTARILFFETWSWFYQNTLQVKKAYEVCIRTVNYMENHPDKIRVNPQPYMAAISSLVNRCTNLGQYDEALKVVEKLEKLPDMQGLKISKSLQTEIFTFSVERKLMIYAYSRQFEKGIEWYEQTKAEIEKNKEVLRPNFLSMYNNLVALCYSHSNQYEKALIHLRFILDELDHNNRTDTILYSHMLHVITHFELKNYSLIPYLTNSTLRYAKSRGFTQKTVILFVKMFNELSKKNSKMEMVKIIANYQPKFSVLNKINSDSVIQGSIDLEYWMDRRSKTLNKT